MQNFTNDKADKVTVVTATGVIPHLPRYA